MDQGRVMLLREICTAVYNGAVSLNPNRMSIPEYQTGEEI